MLGKMKKGEDMRSMKQSNKFLTTLILEGLLLAACGFLAVAATVNDQSLVSVVKNLGVKNENIGDDLELLKSDPHKSVALLVAELHLVPHKVYYQQKKTKDSRHVISCLRALRFLTRQTFTATSIQHLTDDEKQFLDFKNQMHDDNPGHELHFFGVWMSRDADFVAPADAQRKIIKQWQQWQHDCGDSFIYSAAGKAKDSFENWYWFG
jgi:hypothetical protein